MSQSEIGNPPNLLCCSGYCTDGATETDCGACGHECVIRDPLGGLNGTITGTCETRTLNRTALAKTPITGYECVYGAVLAPA